MLIWKGLVEQQGIDGLFFSTVVKSFYGQCAPTNSVHLGLTSIATNWMDRYSENQSLKQCTEILKLK